MFARSRDHARTPFPWDDSAKAGFTTGQPWLKINPNYPQINAKTQMNDASSIRAFYKKLIQLRKDPGFRDCLVEGDFVPVETEDEHIIAFTRNWEQDSILVALNFQDQPGNLTIDDRYDTILLNNSATIDRQSGKVTLGNYQAVVLKRG
ncbi:MAG: alpha-glucosidase C-terminal domain-containing protein [Eubacteriales bacterium]|nr:alpha-glucosidase C-terminal domain-containing protein [Eubacteriales bacterium]